MEKNETPQGIFKYSCLGYKTKICVVITLFYILNVEHCLTTWGVINEVQTCSILKEKLNRFLETNGHDYTPIN